MQNKYTQPLRDRILMSNFDDTVKDCIYKKYLSMMAADEKDYAKYALLNTWTNGGAIMMNANFLWEIFLIKNFMEILKGK